MSSILTINRLMFHGPQDKIEQLKQYKESGLFYPFTYRMGYDGYNKDSFTSVLRGCQEDPIGMNLHTISKAFPTIRFIHSQYRDYEDAPLDFFMTHVYEAGRSFFIGSGSWEEYYKIDTLFYKYGLDLNLDAEEVAKTISFNNESFNGGFSPVRFK